MYLSLCTGVSRCCERRMHTSASRILFNQYNDAVHKKRMHSSRLYWSGFGILMLGFTYAAVPLYRVFCQSYNYGGTLSRNHDGSKVKTMQPVKERVINVRFNADTAATLQWNFKPQQNWIKVVPGETALVFYTAKNPLDVPVTGVSTYNVVPYEAAQYFTKIQCFCFEEQQLNPHEEVDMPVFFYIDPDFVNDPRMENINEIMLSYTFFEAKEGFKLPMPMFLQKK